MTTSNIYNVNDYGIYVEHTYTIIWVKEESNIYIAVERIGEEC